MDVGSLSRGHRCVGVIPRRVPQVIIAPDTRRRLTRFWLGLLGEPLEITLVTFGGCLWLVKSQVLEQS